MHEDNGGGKKNNNPHIYSVLVGAKYTCRWWKKTPLVQRRTIQNRYMWYWLRGPRVSRVHCTISGSCILKVLQAPVSSRKKRQRVTDPTKEKARSAQGKSDNNFWCQQTSVTLCQLCPWLVWQSLRCFLDRLQEEKKSMSDFDKWDPNESSTI